MAPIHQAQPGLPLTAWRLDRAAHAATWDSGIGAARAGGRWNRKGRHVVYTSLDPATTIVEVAVHTGFEYLDAEPHTMTAFTLPDPSAIAIILPDAIPNQRWLEIGARTDGMLDFAEHLLDTHQFVALPSVASPSSWNLLFDPTAAHFAAGKQWVLLDQFRFGLDPRLASLPPASTP